MATSREVLAAAQCLEGIPVRDQISWVKAFRGEGVRIKQTAKIEDKILRALKTKYEGRCSVDWDYLVDGHEMGGTDDCRTLGGSLL
jgi:hypothetical protein